MVNLLFIGKTHRKPRRRHKVRNVLEKRIKKVHLKIKPAE